MLVDLVMKMVTSKELFLFTYKNDILKARMIKKANDYMAKNNYDTIGTKKMTSLELNSRVVSELDH